MSPRIFVDLTRLIRRAQLMVPSGIDRVLAAYARELPRRYPGRVEFVALSRRKMRRLRHELAAALLTAVEAAWRTGHVSAANDRKQMALFVGQLPEERNAPVSDEERHSRRVAATLRAHLLLAPEVEPVPDGEPRPIYVHVSHQGLQDDAAILRIRERTRARLLTFVHDLIPITHPEFCRAGEGQRHVDRLTTIARREAAVIVNSQTTADELAAFYRRAELPPPRIVVAPLGVDQTFRAALPVQPKLGVPGYFVTVGTIEPRKNHLMLLHVWRRIAETAQAPVPKLLLIGRRGWENENVVDLLERGEVIARHVLECPAADDAALLGVLRGATALLFPSFVEGFGLPLVEALAAGVPVVASDIPIFREVGAGIADLVDPLDGLGWLQAVMDYASPHSVRRERQMAKLSSFEVPTWEQHFAIVDELISDLSK